MIRRCTAAGWPVAFAAVLALPAQAQAGASDTVIVTAARQQATATSLPLSIDIVSGDALNAADSGEDIALRIPGVQAAISNGSQTTFQIRGVGAVDHQALTPSAAAVYVDGVFLATNVQASLLAYDLDRIEVLKGPQGALQGRNASSGSINFFSRAPDAQSSAYVEASAGSHERFDLRAAMGGELAPGLNGRLAGRYLRRGPALDNVSGPDAAGGEADEFGLRGALQWTADADLNLLLRAHYEADNGVNPAPRNSGLTLGRHQVSVGADGVQPTANRFYGASLEARGALAEWTITSLTAIEGFVQDYGFDFDGTPAATANLHYDRDFLQGSEDIYARREWSGGSLLVGLALSSDDFSQDYLIWCGTLNRQTLVGTCQYPGAPGRVGPTPASTAPAVSLLTHIDQTRDTGALYAIGDIDLGERLTLSLGARYTVERIEGEGFGQHIYADGVRALNNRSGAGPAQGANAIDESHVNGMAALRYRFAPSHMAYVSWASGYKSAGFNGEVANNFTHYQDEGLFGAETVDAYEIGYKGRPLTSLALQAALFHQDYHHPQARIFVAFALPGGGSIISNSLANLDAADVNGLDLSADWSATADFALTAGLTLLDSEIRQGSDAAGGTNAATFDGNPLPFASKLSATLSARKDWRLPRDRLLTFDVFAKHQSAWFLDAEGRDDRRQGAVTLVDADLRLAFANGLAASVWGRNLTNEDYALSGYGFIGYDTFRSSPVEYGVTLRWAS